MQYVANYSESVSAIDCIVKSIEKYASEETIDSRVHLTHGFGKYVFKLVFYSGIYKFFPSKYNFQVLFTKKLINYFISEYSFDKKQLVYSERLLLIYPKK